MSFFVSFTAFFPSVNLSIFMIVRLKNVRIYSFGLFFDFKKIVNLFLLWFQEIIKTNYFHPSF